MPAKRDTGGHILTEWPFCYVKSAIEHKRRYAHLKTPFGSPLLGRGGLGCLVDLVGHLSAHGPHVERARCNGLKGRIIQRLHDTGSPAL